jgi:hypothetical protein
LKKGIFWKIVAGGGDFRARWIFKKQCFMNVRVGKRVLHGRYDSLAMLLEKLLATA